jgi:hypothetical protein
MDRENLEFFNNLLNQWLEELLRHADQTVIHLRESEFFTENHFYITPNTFVII